MPRTVSALSSDDLPEVCIGVRTQGAAYPCALDLRLSRHRSEGICLARTSGEHPRRVPPVPADTRPSGIREAEALKHPRWDVARIGSRPPSRISVWPRLEGNLWVETSPVPADAPARRYLLVGNIGERGVASAG